MRIELIHPMLVHFPIALLSTGVLIRFAALLISKKSKLSFLLPASWLVLSLGVIAAWVAILAGRLAADIVAPTLENMEILEQHAIHAYRTAFGFTLGLLLDFLRGFLVFKLQQNGWFVKKVLAIFFCLLYLFGLGNLIITGGYGAILVYEENAAVAKPN